MHEDVLGSTAAEEVHENIENLGVKYGGRLEVLAGSGRSGQNEDAGTDDGADAKGSQRPRPKSLLQPMLGLLRFGDQLVDGFAGEKLTGQKAVLA